MESTPLRMMKHATPTLVIAGLAVLLSQGCADPPGPVGNDSHPMPQSQIDDMQIVQVVQEQTVRSGIIAERTIYPYQFAHEGDTLNSLGQQYVEVLAPEVQSHGGNIIVPRGGASAVMYNARCQKVATAFRNAGVSADKIHIIDGMPSGEPTYSVDVLRDVKASRHTNSGQSGSSMYGDSTSGSDQGYINSSDVGSSGMGTGTTSASGGGH